MFEEFSKEVKKCILLCRNCHKEAHSIIYRSEIQKYIQSNLSDLYYESFDSFCDENRKEDK